MKLKMVAWPPSVVACWERSERTLPFLGGSTSLSVYDSAIRLISLLLSAAAATFARMMSVPEPQEGASQDSGWYFCCVLVIVLFCGRSLFRT